MSMSNLMTSSYIILSVSIYMLIHGFLAHTIFIHEEATFHKRSREALRSTDNSIPKELTRNTHIKVSRTALVGNNISLGGLYDSKIY